ncbi:MAG: hypothetical protein ABI604_11105 [Nitrospirota bacterium]
MKKGRCGTMTYDDKRHGITTLFAALNVAEGNLISTCSPTTTPRTNTTVQRWLTRHPHVHMHFTPTSRS